MRVVRDRNKTRSARAGKTGSGTPSPSWRPPRAGRLSPEPGGARSASLRIRQQQLSGRKTLRIDDHLRARLLELVEPIALDVLVLHPEDARILPFAVRRIFDLADDGIEAVGLDVVPELLLIEAADGRHRLLQHLAVRVGEGWNEIAEQVRADRRRLGLVPGKEAFDSLERH